MKKNAAATILIAIGLAAVTVGMIVSAYLMSRFMLKIQHATEKSITVKGVAEKEVMSDLAAFSCSISVKAATQSAGHIELQKAKDVLCAKLDQLNFTENMREDESISCSEIYKTVKTRENNRETSTDVFDHYYLTYSVRIRTTDVKLVEKNILKIYELAMQKLDIDVTPAQYYISNPEQYKLTLVDQASASAAERARTAASQSGSKLGPLMVARQGVIQITSPASSETSDYGVYNTSSVQKVIRLVMTMEFELK